VCEVVRRRERYNGDGIRLTRTPEGPPPGATARIARRGFRRALAGMAREARLRQRVLADDERTDLISETLSFSDVFVFLIFGTRPSMWRWLENYHAVHNVTSVVS
jgi:hypothetical protein